MQNYVNYNFYVNDYKGSLSETLFNRFIVEAEVEVKNNINRKLTDEVINDLTEEELFMLKYATCQLCDFLNKNGTIATKSSGKNISIDGVSISGNSSDDSSYEKNKSKILDNLPQKLIRYI